MEKKVTTHTAEFLGVIAAFVMVFTIAISTPAEAIPFTALLDSAQEVTPGGATNSPLTGLAQLDLTQTAGVFSLSFNIAFDSGFDFGPITGNPSTGGEEITALHFHNNVRGANGPIVFGIFNPSSDLDGDTMTFFNFDGTTTVTGEWDEAEGNGGATLADFLPSLLAAQPGDEVPLYLNLHSADDPAGVIRGQISAVPEPGTFLLLGTGIASLGLWSWKQGQRQRKLS